MFKNKTVYEIKKDERNYLFIFDPTSTIGEIHDVLCEVKNAVVNIINEQHAKEQPVQATDSAEVEKAS